MKKKRYRVCEWIWVRNGMCERFLAGYLWGSEINFPSGRQKGLGCRGISGPQELWGTARRDRTYEERGQPATPAQRQVLENEGCPVHVRNVLSFLTSSPPKTRSSAPVLTNPMKHATFKHSTCYRFSLMCRDENVHFLLNLTWSMNGSA